MITVRVHIRYYAKHVTYEKISNLMKSVSWVWIKAKFTVEFNDH